MILIIKNTSIFEIALTCGFDCDMLRMLGRKTTMKIQIKNRFNGLIIFETEAVSLRAAVELAVKAEVDLTRANLTEANFTGANLTGANFAGANFAGANFAGADLTGANFAGANFTGANLTGANFTGANFTGANFAGANLHRANFTRANLTRANLTGANFVGANLDFSAWPLWCGSKGVKVDARIAAQLAAHFCVLNCRDKKFKAAVKAILKFAKTSHRAHDLGLI